MQKLIDHYFEYLSNNPGKVDSIYLWTISTLIVWGIMFAYKRTMIEGAKGENKLFELPEIVGYIATWMFVPIIFYAVYFFNPIPDMAWYSILFVIAYTLGGRWILEWILAFKTGQSKVIESESKKVTVEEKTEKTTE